MQLLRLSTTFVRPNDTTAYANGDLVANSTTANSVTPMTFKAPLRGIRLWRVFLFRTSTTVTNAKFRLHLFNDSPTVANGDNGAFSSTVSSYQGSVDIDGSGQAFSDFS